MARKPKDIQALPELNEIESEMSQVRSKGRFRQSLKGTLGALVVVVAIAVIIAFNVIMSNRGCEKEYFTRRSIPNGQDVKPYYVISFIAIFLYIIMIDYQSKY